MRYYVFFCCKEVLNNVVKYVVGVDEVIFMVFVEVGML